MDEYNSNNYNIDNISDNYEENNINNYTNDNNNRNSNSNSAENINRIFEENEKRNRIKIDTTEFMSYSIKVELLFQTLQGYLYWISAGEILIFLTLFFIFACKVTKKYPLRTRSTQKYSLNWRPLCPL